MIVVGIKHKTHIKPIQMNQSEMGRFPVDAVLVRQTRKNAF